MGESFEVWAAKACLEMDGMEYEALSQIAQKHKIFLAGNAYELDRNFPGLYFQTCFVINPSGEMILRYRRLCGMRSLFSLHLWAHIIAPTLNHRGKTGMLA